VVETYDEPRCQRLVLWGPMGAGKTSVGRALARRIGRSFVDLDELIETEAGCSTHELFSLEGEPSFRAREARALERTLDRQRSAVIAVGGGALVDRRAREMALRKSLVIGLHAPASTLHERIERSRARRPLVEGRSSEETAARIDQLLSERSDAYRVAHHHVSSEGTPEATAELIARQLEAGLFPITIDSEHAYCARLTEPSVHDALAELVGSLAPSSVFIVSDTNVAPLYVDGVVAALTGAATSVLTIQAGEEHKTLARATSLLESLIEAGADRRSLVIGLGGGVVTDIAGFVASTFSRGIRWIAVPTTTMGMVDAATGGKTAVNLAVAKNSIGTFHHPCAVLVDLAFTRSESERAIRSGLAESIKAAAVADSELFRWLETHGAELGTASSLHLRQAIVGGLRVKCALVEADPEDRHDRLLLNFGHTIGHALEAATGFNRFTHGEAVAIGMVAAARIGVARGVTPVDVALRVRRLIENMGLPSEIPADCLSQAALHLRTDKKRHGVLTHYVVLEDIGRGALLTLQTSELASLTRALDTA